MTDLKHERTGVVTALLVAAVAGVAGFFAVLAFGPGRKDYHTIGEELKCLVQAVSDCYEDARTPAVLKATLHAVQAGLEAYAKEHRGGYPGCLDAPDFPWPKYVWPQDSWQIARSLDKHGIVRLPGTVERCTTANDVHRLAAVDAESPAQAGVIRYYVSTDRRRYAMIMSRWVRGYDILGRGYATDRVGFLKWGGSNHVAHE